MKREKIDLSKEIAMLTDEYGVTREFIADVMGVSSKTLRRKIATMSFYKTERTLLMLRYGKLL